MLSIDIKECMRHWYRISAVQTMTMFSLKIFPHVSLTHRSHPISPQKRSIFWSKFDSKTANCWKTSVTQSTYITIRSLGRRKDETLTRKKEMRGFLPFARSSSSRSSICLSKSTAIKVLPDPIEIQRRRACAHKFHAPVSNTAIIFCCLALSKSSS